jgi:hypothetical protein
MNNVGALNTKLPDVNLIFNKKKLVYEIKSFTILWLIVANNPEPKASPVVGKSVTNDPKMRVRTPPDKPEGEGYWKAVIKNMEGYQYGGDKNR